MRDIFVKDIFRLNNMLNNIENNTNNITRFIKTDLFKECEKIAFCGILLYSVITENKFIRIILLLISIRKLYKIYKNNEYEMNILLDNII